MSNVEIIKAVKSDRVVRGRKIEVLKVGAYCRVSTDSEDQLNSYKSQVAYYTDLIHSNPEWEMVDVYADEAITGTMVSKRDDFQRMINDCMTGKINLVITKSISRFARNTLDTLKYVRMLKEKNVAVMFEDEKINTLTMDGELMLVILSSVAQQEVENISANVKKGLKMKMSRGEFVGFCGCLGYDWIPETKSMVLNKKEAEIVKYIFGRYVSGIGSDTIAKELEELGHKTKRGSSKWCGSTVMGIIKNEKYVGDVLFGKSFTADPITKRRLKNLGEEDKFFIKDNHEPIIDRETFEMAKRIRESRNANRGEYKEGERVDRKARYTRKHDFSSMLRCGFCGEILTRRRWHAGTDHAKTVWQCVSSAKRGKRFCPSSKAVEEKAIKKAFLKSYELLYAKEDSLIEEFLANAQEVLTKGNAEDSIQKTRADLAKNKQKKDNLLNLKLNGLIEDEVFAEKNFMLSQRIDSLEKTIEHLSLENKERLAVEKRIKKFKKMVEAGEMIDEFSREVFESVISHVVVGGYDEKGEENPGMLTFVYKSGAKSKLDAKDFKLRQRKTAACYMDLDSEPLERYLEILHFEDFYPHYQFRDTERMGRLKEMKYTRDISVGILA